MGAIGTEVCEEKGPQREKRAGFSSPSRKPCQEVFAEHVAGIGVFLATLKKIEGRFLE